MPPLAVLDTHALMWFTMGRTEKLGREARRLFRRVTAGEGSGYVPTVVMVEIGEAIHRGRFRVETGLGRWGENIFATRRFLPVDLTWPIVRRAEELLMIPERRDRLIAATALEMQVPLISRDPEISAAGLEVIW